MRSTLHPVYAAARLRCACGNSFETRSTRADLRTEVCSVCHPFFTGQPRGLAADGRIERFNRRWRNAAPATA